VYTPVVYHAVVIRSVRLSRRAEKDLERAPHHIVLKLQGWIDAVKYEGLERVRRIPGYHDEPLEGIWRGYRSIRLNRAYRAIYRITAEESLELVYVERITKHEY
jgi:proteic killer suppression protein